MTAVTLPRAQCGLCGQMVPLRKNAMSETPWRRLRIHKCVGGRKSRGELK